jgi:hypothetical protein
MNNSQIRDIFGFIIRRPHGSERLPVSPSCTRDDGQGIRMTNETGSFSFLYVTTEGSLIGNLAGVR